MDKQTIYTCTFCMMSPTLFNYWEYIGQCLKNIYHLMRNTGNNGLKYGTVRTIIKVYIEY